MKIEGAPEHILIRCNGCGQEACTVSCGENAVVHLRGDLLIEASKCGTCAAKGAPIPACITACRHTEDKQVFEAVSIEEKRGSAAKGLTLLRV
jgi:dissimilatory sulfite reductase (desulfoviridin) alpha/beta subunit